MRFLNRSTPPHIVTLILLASLPALSMNVFVPSLPNMTAYFDAAYWQLQMAISGYLGVNAVLQLFIGPLSDKVGRRPLILGGISIFCLATIGCLMSQTIGWFLVFRMLQAAVVTGMVLSRAVVRDMVPQDQAASMIGYVTMGMAVVPMIGPAIGGQLDEWFGWQSNFWLLFAVGAGVLVLCWRDLGETGPRSGLSLGRQFREYPQLLTSPRFWGYALACAFSSGAFFSYVGGAPFVGSVIFGLDASELGYYFGAPAIGYFVGNFISARFSVRYGINMMVLWGGVIVTIGVGVSILVFAAGHGSALSFFGFMTFVGLGNGLTIPNATAGMLSVRPRLAGTASGLGGAIMIGGGAALSQIAGMMLNPDAGAWPLLWLMFATSAASLLAIGGVILRERQLRGLDVV